MPRPNDFRSPKILEAGLLVLIFLAPFFFGAVHAWAFMALSAVIFLLLFLHPEVFWEYFHLPNHLKISAALLFIYLAVQTLLFSLNRYESTNELLKWLAYGTVFLLIQHLDTSAMRRLAYAVVAVGVLESVYGLYLHAAGRERILWQVKESHTGYLTGTYFNRNHLAGLLELALGAATGLWLEGIQQKNLKKISLLGLFVFVMLLAFFQTGSRMGMISLLLAFMLFILFQSPRKYLKVIFSLSLLIAIAAFFGIKTYMPRFFDVDDYFDLFRSERWIVWQNAYAILRDYLWQGIGLGNFEWIFPLYQSGQLQMGWSHAHNDYLELALSLGVPCFAMLIFFFAGLYFKSFCAKDESALRRGLFLSITAFLIHGLTDFNFAIPANAFLFILLFAMAYRLSKSGWGAYA